MAFLGYLMAGAYLAGSVNFSILLFKALGKTDPRAGFSGNPGVTNVYRLAGPGWAAAVLAADMMRAGGVGLIAVGVIPSGQVPWIGLALILGNRFPVFHGLRGGKGVANYLGFTTVTAPAFAAAAAAAWLAVFALARIPFIASFAMVAVLGAGAAAHAQWQAGAVAGILGTVGLIAWSHRGNIKGLFRP